MTKKGPKRFVILEHTRDRQVHWDFMLEHGDTLQTYRLEMPPDILGERNSEAVRIFDHPLRFLDYEGPVNKGTGSVIRTDSGTYRLIEESGNFRRLELNGETSTTMCVFTHVDADRWEVSFA